VPQPEFDAFDGMAAREADRKERRRQLQLQYEAREAAAAEAAAEVERLAVAEAEAAREAAREARRQEARARQAAAAEAAQRRELAQQQLRLAALHHRRAIMRRCVFEPLRRHWQEARFADSQADVLYLEAVQRRVLLAWGDVAARAARGRRTVDQAKARCAARHHDGALLRAVWRRWAARHAALRRMARAAQRRQEQRLLTAVWRGWRRRCAESQAYQRRLAALADAHRAQATARAVFTGWRAALVVLRDERLLEEERQATFCRVQSWLSQGGAGGSGKQRE
jgi:hypothetical protein